MPQHLPTPIQDYPVHGLLPKEETQAAAFVRKYSEYDGRGTVVAILDTGVDPGAAGMQVTSDGKPKIIDIVDCTGGGDVVTTTVVKATEQEVNGQTRKTLQGLSGRTLEISPKWVNPSGEYHLGLKRAYELFPKDLLNRLKEQRKKMFEKKHIELLVESQNALVTFDRENRNPTAEADLLRRSDLEARVEALKTAMKTYEDPGVILDCVLFNDGKDWRAVIDVEGSGDLTEQPCLTDYRKELKYHTFGKLDLLNFSVNIYEDGNLLSIVTLAGSHGTHVAGITAANFPEDPALNGVAPGAQIVSLRIGDVRLGSMETGPGLTRAATHLAINKCDLANMSYGESCALPTDGHFAQLLAEEVISKVGCTFVVSAGNSGPCFSSMGAPCGMYHGLIGVGAYVMHSQMQAEYFMLETVAEQPTTWSARGPAVDGYKGVDIYAPGSAITSVPVYGLTKLEFKNGTSMSSPNACGCIALLISGLKAKNQVITPFRLKTAVVNSSKQVDDPLNVGFIQVDQAWEYLQKFDERKDLDMLFQTRVSRHGGQRGIYLREQEETSIVLNTTASIVPNFMSEQDPSNPVYSTDRVEFECRVAMVSTQPWIKAPSFVYLHANGGNFDVRVDPTQLTAGQFHYGEILGYDTQCPDRGPLFCLPVSVAKPIVPKSATLQFQNVNFEPGVIRRWFVAVPAGATHCELTIKSQPSQVTSAARFMLHILQLVPKRSQRNKIAYSMFLGRGSYCDPASEHQVIKKRFAVTGGLNCEIALAQFWSGLGYHNVDVNLEFHGVQVAGNFSDGTSTLTLSPQITRLELVAPIRREEDTDISVNFDVLRKHIRPTSASIAPLDKARDRLPNGKQIYGLTLTYSFKVESNGTSITPNIPTVMDQLYDHYLSGVFGMVYDSNNKIIDYLDVYPKKIKFEKKGDYTIRMHLTSENEDILDKLKATVLHLDISISKAISFLTHKSIADVYKSDKSTFAKVILEKGDYKVCYIAAPHDHSILPKDAKVGDALVGKLNFTAEKVDGGQYKAVYYIPSPPSETPTPQANEKDEDADLQQKMLDAVKDLQISHLKKFPAGSEARKKVFEQLEKEQEDYIPFLEYKLETLVNVDSLIQTPSNKANAVEAVKVAESLLDKMDLKALAEYFGVRDENKTAKRKQIRKENEKKKQTAVNALRGKCIALSVLLDHEPSNSSHQQEFESTFSQLQQWTDGNGSTSSDLATVLLLVARERRANRLGSAVKALNKFISDSSDQASLNKAYKIRRELYADLDWDLWQEYDSQWALINCPPTGFAPF